MSEPTERTLIVSVEGNKRFRLSIPTQAKVTFGPWSPPSTKGYERNSTGTLRVYANHKAGADCLFVQSGVIGYRDRSAIGYEQEVLREEGAVIWKNDETGYSREAKTSGKREWTQPELPEAAQYEDDDPF